MGVIIRTNLSAMQIRTTTRPIRVFFSFTLYILLYICQHCISDMHIFYMIHMLIVTQYVCGVVCGCVWCVGVWCSAVRCGSSVVRCGAVQCCAVLFWAEVGCGLVWCMKYTLHVAASRH